MRFFLAEDGDCHWFVVPVERRTEWDEWADLPSSDERAWTPPDYARAVGGSPSALVTFSNPVIE
jgi:hypothetical protein